MNDLSQLENLHSVNSQSTNTDVITITVFTDPMMGLSYESEPMIRRLETHFEGVLNIKYAMSVLVPNVYNFVNPNDLTISKDFALTQYAKRLGQIYNEEEIIAGLPIDMGPCRLFDTEHTTSKPLNLAYKAMELLTPHKAQNFLYDLRYVTIVEQKQMTEVAELCELATTFGIPRETFLKTYASETVELALLDDLKLREMYGIRALPSYLIEYNKKQLVVSGVFSYGEMVRHIQTVTNNAIQAKSVPFSEKMLSKIMEAHPHIHYLELRNAFDLTDSSVLDTALKQWQIEGIIDKEPVKGSFFIRYKK